MDCERFLSVLDDYIDSLLSEEEMAQADEHVLGCSSCAAVLREAQALSGIMREMKDDITPPLAAQAAWRRAVKREEKRGRARGVYRAITAVAAALVLMIGVGAGIKLFGSDSQMGVEPKASDFSFVETDGHVDDEAATIKARSSTATAKLSSDDVSGAADLVCQLVGEFNGSVSVSSENGGTAYINASIPKDEFIAFMSSLDYAGTVQARQISIEGVGWVNITVTIVKPSK